MYVPKNLQKISQFKNWLWKLKQNTQKKKLVVLEFQISQVLLSIFCYGLTEVFSFNIQFNLTEI